MNIQQQLGSTVRRLRQERGITQAQLAYDAGIDRRYMSDIEQGKRNLSLGVIERLATVLGLTLFQLFQEIEKHQ